MNDNTTRLLKAGTHKHIPWKNGLGFTTQIAIFPEDADLDTFGYRINLAKVTGNEPFSCLPNVERTLFVTEGQGIRLFHQGRNNLVTPQTPAYRFNGDAETPLKLVDGPIIDFNIMTRRGQFDHVAERLPAAGPIALEAGGGIRFLFCNRGMARLRVGQAEFRLHDQDAAFAELGDGEPWEVWVGSGSDVYFVSLTPSAPKP